MEFFEERIDDLTEDLKESIRDITELLKTNNCLSRREGRKIIVFDGTDCFVWTYSSNKVVNKVINIINYNLEKFSIGSY